jgi:hypothetical protein
MALDAQEIIVAGTGAVYRAPVGTSMPANVTSTPSVLSGWEHLGYTAESGVKFSFSRSVNEVKGWQSYQPLRIIVTEVPIETEFELLQWNNVTVETAMGGGSFEEQGDGVRYTPPAESFVDEFAMIVDGKDGAFTYRYFFPRVMVSDKVEFSFVRSNPVGLPIKVKVLAAPEGGSTFNFDTDDTSLVADAPA